MGLKCCLPTVIAISTGIALGGFRSYAADSDRDPQLASDAGPKPPPSAAPSVPDGASVSAKAAAAAKTLERILANWKSREDRTRSIYLSWESRLFAGKAAADRRKGKGSAQQAERFGQVALWAERPYRFRLDSAHFTGPTPRAAALAAKTHSVMNGLTELAESPGRPLGSSLATFSKRRGRYPLETYAPALTLAFHPLDAFVLRSQSRKFRVVAEDTLRDDLHCVQIQIAGNNGTFFEDCWVDPARDDLVVAYESWRRFNERREVNSPISIEYQRDRDYGWVPARWTVGNGTYSENTVTKYAINDRFPEETFSLKVSPGTVVFDERTCEQYRVVAEGGKSEVVRFDSRNSLRIQKVLQSISDIRIEPQNLQDALDFISARYQIPIVFHEADFQAAGFSGNLMVVVRRQGITVADLLKLLSAQCPKPLGFRIEDEVLKVSPKFTEQGVLRVRPAPKMQKLDSPQARKIQEAMEMPVNFNIEPQTLREALNWIGERFRIVILIDPSVAANTNVKLSAPGIKLRSFLAIILEQCPQPLTFRIKGNMLKIEPDGVAP
jgi:hypothetical protein